MATQLIIPSRAIDIVEAFAVPKEKRTRNTIPHEHRWIVLQVARLEVVGGQVTCDRNKPFTLSLPPEDA